MVFSSGNRDRIGQVRWHNGLTNEIAVGVGVVTPSEDGAIGPDGQAMVAAGGHGDDADQFGAKVALAQTVVAPGGKGAVGAQGQTVPGAGGDGEDAAERGWDRGLAVIVSA